MRQTLARAAVGKLVPNSRIQQFIEYQHLVDLLDTIDQLILAYLDINAIINFTLASKSPWYPRPIIHPTVLKEIQQRYRTRRVTVYTWFQRTSSVNSYSDLDLGHSALRTWSGGKNDGGIYVSFYPSHTRKTGDCPEDCKKSVSHFHPLKQESVEGVKKIDLYGLDVAAINQAFQLLHDQNMNSFKSWSARFNCSDLVLKLLEIGGLHKKINLRRYSETSVIILGIIFGQLSLDFIRLHPILLEKWSHIFSRGLINGPYHDYFDKNFSLYYDGIRIFSPSLITFFLFFAYAISSFWRSGAPIYYFRKQIFLDSRKAALFSVLWLVLSSKNIMKWRSLPTFLQIFKKIFVQMGNDFHESLVKLFQKFQNTIMSGSLIYLINPSSGGTLIRRAPGKPVENQSSITNTLFLASLLTTLPIIMVVFSSSYLYNTTTMPQHVFNIAARVRDKLKYNTESSAQSSSLPFNWWKHFLWQNKTKIFIATGTLIGLTIFKKHSVTVHGIEANVLRTSI